MLLKNDLVLLIVRWGVYKQRLTENTNTHTHTQTHTQTHPHTNTHSYTTYTQCVDKSAQCDLEYVQKLWQQCAVDRLAVMLIAQQQVCSNSVQPRGTYLRDRRHLEILGYRVVEVSSFSVLYLSSSCCLSYCFHVLQNRPGIRVNTLAGQRYWEA